jgi:catechol 2,3-dioxygenase-like lactoylglutathione lyase family enzyme
MKPLTIQPMKQSLALVAILVDDYDKAINYYTQSLGFQLAEDKRINESKRWIVVTPPGSSCSLLLAKASGEAQELSIGNQTGGRVFLFLHTDNFDRDYARLLEHDIEIVREQTIEPHGKVAVFKDIFGNLWDLIEPA